MSCLRPILHLILATLMAALASPAVRGQPTSFGERLEVREAEAVVAFQEVLSRKQLRQLRPQDLSVVLGGEAATVTRIEPLTTGEGTVLIWLDSAMAGHEARQRAALALAERASVLTSLGAVEVVVASPEPRVLLAATTAPLRVEEVLVGSARKMPQMRQELAGPGGKLPREASGAAAAWQGLARWATVRGGESPRILLVVSDGIALAPEELERLLEGYEAPAEAIGEQVASLPSTDPVVAMLAATRELAIAGWATISLPLKAGKTQQQAAEALSRGDSHSGGSYFINFSFVINWIRAKVTGNKPQQPLIDPHALEVAVSVQTAPLRRLAAETAGQVVATEEELDGALESLAGRLRVWWQVPEVPAEEIRPFELRHPLHGSLPAPRWVRLTAAPAVPTED